MQPTPITAQDLLAHEAFVRSLARSLVAHEEDVRDLVQETWVRALSSRAHKLANPRAWLARVVRNLASDQHRRTANRRAHEGAVAAAEQGASVESVAASAARLEAQRTLVDAVLALGSPYRDVILLVHFQGLEPTEAAQRLRRDPQTVRSQLHRAHAKLKARLDINQADEPSAWATLLLPQSPAQAPPRAPSSREIPLPRRQALSRWKALVLAGGATAVAVGVGLTLVPSPFERADLPMLADRPTLSPGSALGSGQLPASHLDDETEGNRASTRDGLLVRVNLADGVREVPLGGLRVLLLDQERFNPDLLRLEPHLPLDLVGILERFGRPQTTDEGGRARFPQPAGKAILYANSAGLIGLAELDGADQTEVLLTLEPSEEARVRVVDRTGRMAPDVPVAVVARLDGGQQAQVLQLRSTDQGGTARFVGFGSFLQWNNGDPPAFGVRLEVPGLRVHTALAAVKGHPETVTLRLESTGSLRLELVDTAGDALDDQGRITLSEKNVLEAPELARAPAHGVALFAHVGLGHHFVARISLPHRGLEWSADFEGPVTPGEMRTVRITPPDSPTLSGTVLDSEGRPLSEQPVFVLLRSSKREGLLSRFVWTQTDGTFRLGLGDQVPMHTATLVSVVRYRGSTPIARADTDNPIAFGPHVNDLGIFRLRSVQGRINGFCLTSEGDPVEGLGVEVSLDFDRRFAFAETGPDGAFSVSGLFPDPPTFSIRSDQWVLTGTEPDSVDPRTTLLRVERGGSIAGSVILAEGASEQEAPQVWVFFSNERDRTDRLWVGATSVDMETGQFHVDGLAAGEYDVTINAKGVHLEEALVSVDAVRVHLGHTTRDPRLQAMTPTSWARARDDNSDAPPSGIRLELFSNTTLALRSGDRTAHLSLCLERGGRSTTEESRYVPVSAELARGGHVNVVLPAPGLYRLCVSRSQPSGSGVMMASRPIALQGPYTLRIREQDQDATLWLPLPASVFE